MAHWGAPGGRGGPVLTGHQIIQSSYHSVLDGPSAERLALCPDGPLTPACSRQALRILMW
ncbi:MAG: hypothetical protein F4X39_06450 [Acidobacteriia bacterium]|nr:hypothetical protein [Terriglobia bacterium]